MRLLLKKKESKNIKTHFLPRKYFFLQKNLPLKEFTKRWSILEGNRLFSIINISKFVPIAHLSNEFGKFISENGILRNHYLGYVYFYGMVLSHQHKSS